MLSQFWNMPQVWWNPRYRLWPNREASRKRPLLPSIKWPLSSPRRSQHCSKAPRWERRHSARSISPPVSTNPDSGPWRVFSNSRERRNRPLGRNGSNTSASSFFHGVCASSIRFLKAQENSNHGIHHIYGGRDFTKHVLRRDDRSYTDGSQRHHRPGGRFHRAVYRKNLEHRHHNGNLRYAR